MHRRPPRSPPFPYTTLFRSMSSPSAVRRRRRKDHRAEELSMRTETSRSEEHTPELQSQFHLLSPLYFFQCTAAPRDLPPSPTRRSSDLCHPPRRFGGGAGRIIGRRCCRCERKPRRNDNDEYREGFTHRSLVERD